MLSHKLLKNHAGILLCGDHMTLEALHQVVHEVNDQSVLIEDKEGMFLGLAYDARKAFEGQRTVIKPDKHFPEIGMRYGVEILWPVLLLQCRLLRCSLAYFDSTKRQQSITCALEDVIETAIDCLRFRILDAPWLPALPQLDAVSQAWRQRASFTKTLPR
jgi:hypothetical protein